MELIDFAYIENVCAKVFAKLSSIPNIDNGGCCFVALGLREYLKRKNIDVSLCCLYGINVADYHENNMIAIRNKHARAFACQHVVVAHNGDFYDSRGYIPPRELGKYRYSHEVTVDFLWRMINEGSWNNSFNRNDVKQIDKILKTNIYEELCFMRRSRD